MVEKNILVIVKSTPYTTLNSYESLRTAVGLWDHNVKLLWTEDAVYNLLREADQSQIGPFLSYLTDLDIELYVYQESLVQRGLNSENLIDNIVSLDRQGFVNMLEDVDTTLVF